MPSPFFSSSCSCPWPGVWRPQRAGRPGGPPACPPGSAGPPGFAPPKGIWNENAYFAPAQKSEISLHSRKCCALFCNIFKFSHLSYVTFLQAMFAKNAKIHFREYFLEKGLIRFKPILTVSRNHSTKTFSNFPDCRTRNMLAKMRKYIFAKILSKTIIFVLGLSSPCPATAPPLRPGPVAAASPHSQMPKMKRE